VMWAGWEGRRSGHSERRFGTKGLGPGYQQHRSRVSGDSGLKRKHKHRCKHEWREALL
jgi:hypothetical protein